MRTMVMACVWELIGGLVVSEIMGKISMWILRSGRMKVLAHLISVVVCGHAVAQKPAKPMTKNNPSQLIFRLCTITH